jgi:undecaprenyl-diphosphatase
MQSLALFPGISRSGSTISAACMRGWSLEEAVRFSFLLAIPTMLGGMLAELASLMTSSASAAAALSVSPSSYLLGFFSAFFSGFIGAKCIFSLKNKKVLFIFAFYCLLLGICSLVYFSF